MIRQIPSSSFWSAVVQSMIRKVFLCLKVSVTPLSPLRKFLGSLAHRRNQGDRKNDIECTVSSQGEKGALSVFAAVNGAT